MVEEIIKQGDPIPIFNELENKIGKHHSPMKFHEMRPSTKDKRKYSQDIFKKRLSEKTTYEPYIFILGMPRSGTTIVEQIAMIAIIRIMPMLAMRRRSQP